MTDQLGRRIEQIWAATEPVVLERIVALEEAAEHPTPEQVARAVDAAHKLAGSLGMLGRRRAGRAATEAESLLARLDGPLPVDARVRLAELAAEMRASLHVRE